jgi:hypothetical protein
VTAQTELTIHGWPVSVLSRLKAAKKQIHAFISDLTSTSIWTPLTVLPIGRCAEVRPLGSQLPSESVEEARTTGSSVAEVNLGQGLFPGPAPSPWDPALVVRCGQVEKSMPRETFGGSRGLMQTVKNVLQMTTTGRWSC